MIRLTAGALAMVVCGAALAAAGETELALFAGPSVPTYEQSFRYDPGSLLPVIPGVTIHQESTFDLVANGGLAVGGSLAFFPSSVVGLEARVDSVGIDVTTTGARFAASVLLPPPLPPLSTSVDLSGGQVDVARLTPLTLGVKLRTPGRARVFASAGVSYLPKLSATVRQTIGVGIGGVGVLPSSIDVATLNLRAEALPSAGESRWGWSAGAGLQLSMGKSVALQAEGRAFRFSKQTLAWGPGDGPLSPVEEALVKAAQERLDPVEFSPTFFQVTAGIALRF